jgi:predicted TIM-barrel fold metal-dependent hydrolase
MLPSTAAAAPPPAPAKPCACGRIDVHSHYLPPAYRKALNAAGLVKLDGGIPVPPWSVEAHLQMMQAQGISSSVLSISSPGLHFLDPATAVRVAREVNEEGAGLVRDHAGKFGYFATLPLPDIAASVAELDYAFDHLQADGVCLETNAKGLYLGDPTFTPVFDALERRKAVLFLHPTSPACLDQIGMGFPAPLLEFPFDTARSAISLIFSGVLKARPNIRVILSHGGGALPILASRAAMVAQTPMVSPRPEGGGSEVMAQVRRLYFDLALSANPITLNALLQLTEPSHIMFGTDYPFAPPPAIAGNTAAFDRLMTGLSPEQQRMISSENAEALFPKLIKANASAG